VNAGAPPLVAPKSHGAKRVHVISVGRRALGIGRKAHAGEVKDDVRPRLLDRRVDRLGALSRRRTTERGCLTGSPTPVTSTSSPRSIGTLVSTRPTNPLPPV
jgi:hypothetical protein